MVSILRSVCIILFYSLFWTTSAANNESCTDVFTLQPPTDLNCNPQNSEIQLFCEVEIANSANKTLKWFRGCKNKSEITADEKYNVFNFNDSSLLNSSITFNVTNDTTGFYWCAVFYTNNDSEITRTDATRVYQFKSNCPCSENTTYNMHDDNRQCFNKNKPDMCLSKPQFSPAPIIVPLVAAFITLVVLWIGLIVHARYLGALKNMTTPPASQPFNRSYNKHALAEHDTDIENDCYVDSKNSILDTEKQTNLNEQSDNKQPSRPAYGKEPAEYLKPVKTTDTKPSERMQDSIAGKSCSYKDGMVKSTDTTIHVQVYGNTEDI